MKNILVVGSGGREHAIARAFAKSTQVASVLVVPGNPGMIEGKISTRSLAVDDVEGLLDLAKQEKIDLTFVGPEQALVKGVVDSFEKEGLAVVGPTKSAARLESSKQFAKEVMKAAGVKTGRHHYFKPGDLLAALEEIDQLTPPYVIKEDALAAGKGVSIVSDVEEAKKIVKESLSAGHSLLLEEFLEGEEFSHFSLVNGEKVIPLTVARDYKRIYDNDKGPNTGGMGAFSPVPFVDQSLCDQVVEEIVGPVAKQMVEMGCPYTGVLYTGLILTKEGPKVIEFNARFGDPETQVILQRLKNDFVDLLEAHLAKREVIAEFSDEWVAGVVLAAAGYPSTYKKGLPIDITKSHKSSIYFAGVTQEEKASEEHYKSAGGRILMATGRGKDLSQAIKVAYDEIKSIDATDCYYRKDIGKAFIKD